MVLLKENSPRGWGILPIYKTLNLYGHFHLPPGLGGGGQWKQFCAAIVNTIENNGFLLAATLNAKIVASPVCLTGINASNEYFWGKA